MTLALCKCNVDDLQAVCDLECRLKQRNRIEMVCDDPPYLRVNYPDGETVCYVREGKGYFITLTLMFM